MEINITAMLDSGLQGYYYILSP